MQPHRLKDRHCKCPILLPRTLVSCASRRSELPSFLPKEAKVALGGPFVISDNRKHSCKLATRDQRFRASLGWLQSRNRVCHIAKTLCWYCLLLTLQVVYALFSPPSIQADLQKFRTCLSSRKLRWAYLCRVRSLNLTARLCRAPMLLPHVASRSPWPSRTS